MSEEKDLNKEDAGEETAQPTLLKLPTKAAPGRIVHYVAKDGTHQGLHGGVHYPATIVRVWSENCATISVFTESAQFPLHVIYSANRDDDGAEGTWHWPELT